MSYLISSLIIIPLLTAALLTMVRPHHVSLLRAAAMASSLAQVLILPFLWANLDGNGGYSSVEQASWFSIKLQYHLTFAASYIVGVDGLSVSLVTLSVLIMLVASFSSYGITEKPKGYYILLLILNASIIGCFCALDLLLFFVFFEFMLIPLYFLIGIWGGKNREYASTKFFLYTFLGSIFILIAIIAIYLSSSVPGMGGSVSTFNFMDLNSPWSLAMSDTTRPWVFLLFFLGFAIKLPVVPLHTWLPDAHVEAPTAVSIVLAALVLKVGGYGLIRFVFPLFHAEVLQFSTVIAGFAVLSIIYGALNAMACKDLKRLVAYSSVSHMGFVLLGMVSLNTEGITGAAYQMVSHGILSCMLFFLAGVLSDRNGDRTIGNYSGLAQHMPRYAGYTLIAFVASIGLPGFSGFIGELLVLMGALQYGAPDYVPQWMAIITALGLILGAAYFLWAYQRMFLGPYFVRQPVTGKMEDLTFRELAVLLPAAAIALLLGVFPSLLLKWLNPFSTSWIQDFFSPSTFTP